MIASRGLPPLEDGRRAFDTEQEHRQSVERCDVVCHQSPVEGVGPWRMPDQSQWATGPTRFMDALATRFVADPDAPLYISGEGASLVSGC